MPWSRRRLLAGAAAGLLPGAWGAAAGVAAPTFIDTPDAPVAPPSATRLPPGTRLDFELRRGGLRGQAEWRWQPQAGHYTLSLQATALGMTVLSWHSEGRLDRSGLAPDRYLDRRRSRDPRSAEFRREQGIVTYSDTPEQEPLRPGMQDRLSWMVQLPAIVAATPAKYPVDARVTMVVTGARGDVDLWVFRVIGVEALELPSGPVPGALRLLRLPRKPHDTRVEVWLDPAQHHLPARLLMGSFEDGDLNEFVRMRATPLP